MISLSSTLKFTFHTECTGVQISGHAWQGGILVFLGCSIFSLFHSLVDYDIVLVVASECSQNFLASLGLSRVRFGTSSTGGVYEEVDRELFHHSQNPRKLSMWCPRFVLPSVTQRRSYRELGDKDLSKRWRWYGMPGNKQQAAADVQ